MENNTKPAESYNPSAFWRAGNLKSSVRLRLLHSVCQDTLGFLLQQQVELDTPPTCCIADLGCGNGAWLTRLSHELPNRGNILPFVPILHGFDINDTLFPHPENLPESVSLRKADIFARRIPDTAGAYDVVHIREFSTRVLDENTSSLLFRAGGMLKRGGWLQWEEIDLDSLAIEPAVPDLQMSACEALKQALTTGRERKGRKSDYLYNFKGYLQQNGFENIQIFEVPVPKLDYKAWTESYLMAWEEATLSFPSKITEPDAPITREFWAENLLKAVDETEKGVMVHPETTFTFIARRQI
ncbi:hypothetical protein O1611_g8548 [Lasiodiplodia mahajangana]|uniref:Uncharacterized protein n=1 Tax=Lasiodiplodia mahajangana TaxID=1108764 RepID=A0ACC2JCS3_9PEZI|nr:hypothetical protein O1611_g8548 [Lasiodiplodia mahajangana]